MHELSLKLAAWATDRFYAMRDERGYAMRDERGYAMRDERGQATVEYVGLTVVLGTGIGLIVTGLDGLGFATKIGSKLIGGITSALGKIT